MAKIHPTAIVDVNAEIADSVEIGPYCTVGPKVKLADGVRLISHAVVENQTTVGEGTVIHPFAVVGGNAQHRAYINEPDCGTLTIGKNNTISEHVSIHIGTPVDKSITVIGDNCLFMGGVHIAHDCILGNNIIMSNNATLGGHVKVEDFAIIGGLSAVHQFCRIGRLGMLGGMSATTQDIIPYGIFMGAYGTGHLRGLNLVGMKRHEITKEDLSTTMKAYKSLFDKENGTFAERLEKVQQEYQSCAPVLDILNFINADKDKPIAMPLDNDANVKF